jgi:hypothetical protein
MERYLRVNLLGPGPRRMKKEFTGPRSNKGRETLAWIIAAGSQGPNQTANLRISVKNTLD